MPHLRRYIFCVNKVGQFGNSYTTQHKENITKLLIKERKKCILFSHTEYHNAITHHTNEKHKMVLCTSNTLETLVHKIVIYFALQKLACFAY